MAEVKIDPEELELIIKNAVEGSLVDMFGFQSKDEASKLMRQMADSARRSTEFYENVIDSSKQGVWAAVKMIVKVLVYAAFAFIILNIVPDTWVPKLAKFLK